MVECVMLSILLHLSSIREMKGDTATIVLPLQQTYLTFVIQNKRKSLVAYWLHPVGAMVATRKHSVADLCLLAHDQFRSTLPPEGIGEHDRELL